MCIYILYIYTYFSQQTLIAGHPFSDDLNIAGLGHSNRLRISAENGRQAIETFGDEILVRGKARLWLKAHKTELLIDGKFG